MTADAFLIDAASRGAAVTYDPRMGVWELTADFACDTEYGRIVVHNGFRFDLASIPRLFWRLMAPYELSVEAALIHDLLYRRGGKLRRREFEGEHVFTRGEADRLFLRDMESRGVSWLRRHAAYYAVRAFGRGSWRG